MKLAKIEEGFFRGLMVASTAVILAALVGILGAVLVKGLPAMNLAMVTQAPKGGFYLGKEGGILNAIVGSLYVTGGATIISFLVALPIVLYLNAYEKKGSKLVVLTRFSFDVLWGVPSIVYGAFGFAIMLFFGLRASVLGGIIAVALLMLPIMARAMDEVVCMVPKDLLDASYSVGATRLETARKVLARQAFPGILTAILIAFGRGIGDAASVMFTAGYSDSIPFSLFRPAATLPLAIFFQLGTPVPQVQERAYASALVLTVLILVTSIVARLIGRRFARHTIG